VTTDGCDAQPTFRFSNVGLDALWVMSFPSQWGESTFAGTVYPDHTDIYAGTQDEGLRVSRDGGATWFGVLQLAPHKFFGDNIEVIADHTGPPSRMLFTTGGGEIFQPTLWGSTDEARTSNDNPLPGVPPDACTRRSGFFECRPEYVQIGPSAYAFIGPTVEPVPCDLIVTTDGGQTYSRMGPQQLPGGRAGLPKASGPVASPTIYYLAFDDSTNATGLYRVSGPLDSSATVTRAQGLQQPNMYAVSPTDPNFLYVSDIGAQQMLFSHDGGATWIVDQALTDLITHHGQYEFTAPFPEPDPGDAAFANTVPWGQVTAIGVDPSGQTILVGTWTAGIFATFDGGAHWREIPGSQLIPRPSGFFFNEKTGAIYVGSTGRGVWRIDVPGRENGAKPSITGFSPSNGPTGTPVTITGHNLDEVTEVAFNGVAATPIHDPDGSLTVAVPPGTQETGQIIVATPIYSDASHKIFTVTSP
jgi:hypothetical protein